MKFRQKKSRLWDEQVLTLLPTLPKNVSQLSGLPLVKLIATSLTRVKCLKLTVPCTGALEVKGEVKVEVRCATATQFRSVVCCVRCDGNRQS